MVDFSKKPEPPKPTSRPSIFGKPSNPVSVEQKVTPVVSVQQPQVKPTITRTSMFATNPANVLVDKAVDYMRSNYQDIFVSDESALRGLVRRLSTLDLSTITSWGEEYMSEHRKLIQQAMVRIQEFNKLGSRELLAKAINVAQEKNNGFLTKFKKVESVDSYLQRIEGLKVHLQGLLPKIEDCHKICKGNGLALHLVALASVNDTSKSGDSVVEDALFNRRRIIQQSIENVRAVEAELDATRKMIVEQQNEIDYVLTVTLGNISRINART